MDASALLKRQGWRGAGHSLDHTGRGIAKPLLISHKVDVLGVGKKKTQVADQWWMRAFDNSLKELGIGKQTTLSQIREGGVNRGGLYGFFVKGGGLSGTISDTDISTPALTSGTMSPATNGTVTSDASPTPATTSIHPTAMAAPPTNDKKRKREKETREEIRKRRKADRSEKAKQNAMAKRDKAIAEGTLDLAAEEEKRKLRELNRRAEEFVKQALAEGKFGEVPPHPAEAARMAKEAEKKAKREAREARFAGAHGDMNADRLKMITSGTAPQTNGDSAAPVQTGKKLSYKAQKYIREKAKRVAKREYKAKLEAELFPERAKPVEVDSTQQELAEKRKQEKAAEKEAKAKKRAEKAAKSEEKERRKAEAREAKKARRAEKVKNRAETARKIAEMKAAKAAEAEAAKNGRGSLLNKGPVAAPEIDGLFPPAQNQSLAPAGQDGVSVPDGDGFAKGMDEIKLGLDTRGKVKKIPGVGRVDRYPSAAEKKQKKIEARAFEAGISVEEYLAREAAAKAEKEAPERERIAAVQAARGGLTAKQFRRKQAIEQWDREEAERKAAEAGISVEEYLAQNPPANAGHVSSDGGVALPDVPAALTNGDVVQKDPEPVAPVPAEPISEKKKAKYAAKAAEKGITVEELLAKKAAKAAKKAVKAEPAAAQPAENTAVAGDVQMTDAPQDAGAGFVVDTKGDATLTIPPSAETNGFIIDTAGDPDIVQKKETEASAPIVWHPSMLGDRKVKDLSKAERRARLEWMRARRAARHASEGKTPLSKKERHKKRMEKKLHQQNQIVGQIMREKGKKREDVTKEDLEEARRKAKRQMKEEKKIRRNKVIHRKKWASEGGRNN